MYCVYVRSACFCAVYAMAPAEDEDDPQQEAMLQSDVPMRMSLDTTFMVRQQRRAEAHAHEYRVDPAGAVAFRNSPQMADRSSQVAQAGARIEVGGRTQTGEGWWVQEKSTQLWLPVQFLLPVDPVESQVAAKIPVPSPAPTRTPASGSTGPVDGDTLQPSSFHEFLVNRGLAQHEAALSELGVTKLSHIVDVTAEDLFDVMTPDEARRLVSEQPSSESQPQAAELPDASSCAQAAVASLPQEQAPNTTGRTSDPVDGNTLRPSMPSVVAQPSGFHEFLANRGLAQHEAALSEIGVTELSHIVDVTAEDLIAFMTPDEARRFFSFAGAMTPNAA